MGYITPAQFRSGLETTKEYVDQKVVSGGGNGAIPAYIVGNTPFAANWLSLTTGGTAISPTANSTYIVMSQGEYLRKMYMWNGSEYVLVSQKINIYYTDIDNDLFPAQTIRFGRGYDATFCNVQVSKYAVSATLSMNLVAQEGHQVTFYYKINNGTESSFQIGNVTKETRELNVTGGDRIYIRATKTDSLGSGWNEVNVSIVEHLKVPTETDEYLPINSYSDTTNGQSGLVPSIASDTTAEALTPKGWDEIDFNVTPEEIRRLFLSIGGGARQGDGNPIGTILSYMGKIAPYGYLICDGTSYNIADYQNLADFFEIQFGTKNYFGGDGNDTFAVPDLRGEFLRGSGTNGHANQGRGDEVGKHQDGTTIGVASGNLGQNIWASEYSSSGEDSITSVKRAIVSTTTQVETGGMKITSRPTNTSVLYIIKY